MTATTTSPALFNLPPRCSMAMTTIRLDRLPRGGRPCARSPHPDDSATRRASYRQDPGPPGPHPTDAGAVGIAATSCGDHRRSRTGWSPPVGTFSTSSSSFAGSMVRASSAWSSTVQHSTQASGPRTTSADDRRYCVAGPLRSASTPVRRAPSSQPRPSHRRPDSMSSCHRHPDREGDAARRPRISTATLPPAVDLEK
jgi:hypothetical protein